MPSECPYCGAKRVYRGKLEKVGTCYACHKQVHPDEQTPQQRGEVVREFERVGEA